MHTPAIPFFVICTHFIIIITVPSPDGLEDFQNIRMADVVNIINIRSKLRI